MQSIQQKLYSHLSFLIIKKKERKKGREGKQIGKIVCVCAAACLSASMFRHKYCRRAKARQVEKLLPQSCVLAHTHTHTYRCTGGLRPLDGTVMRFSFLFFFQSRSNNQFMCGVLCQKRGNINSFAPGNLNISRKDINTITTQTHTPTRRPH